MDKTGKKSFISKFSNKKPIGSNNSPHGVEFVINNEKIGPGTYVYNFWNFNNITQTTKMHYKDAVVIFVMVDHRSITLDIARLFKKDINAKFDALEYSRPTNPVILLVNKIDLLDEETRSKLNYDDLCKDYGFDRWIPISTKTISGIELAYRTMIDICKSAIIPQEDLIKEKVVADLNADIFIKSVLDLYKNKFDENDAKSVFMLKELFLVLYFLPNMEHNREKIKTDYSLRNVIDDMHNILTDHTCTDHVILARILNCILDYGKPF